MNIIELVKRDRKEIIEEWLSALESGEIDQTRGFLWRVKNVAAGANPNSPPPGMCCLGVVGNILSRRYPDVVSWKKTGGQKKLLIKGVPMFLDETFVSLATLPSYVWDVLIPENIKDAKLSLMHLSSNMNDKGVPFVEIASHVRERLSKSNA